MNEPHATTDTLIAMQYADTVTSEQATRLPAPVVHFHPQPAPLREPKNRAERRATKRKIKGAGPALRKKRWNPFGMAGTHG
jgi:hypothetical protein